MFYGDCNPFSKKSAMYVLISEHTAKLQVIHLAGYSTGNVFKNGSSNLRV